MSMKSTSKKLSEKQIMAHIIRIARRQKPLKGLPGKDVCTYKPTDRIGYVIDVELDAVARK